MAALTDPFTAANYKLMRQAIIHSSFKSWRETARGLLRQHCHPDELMWMEETDAEPHLDFFDNTAPNSDPTTAQFRVPPEFMRIARKVSRNADPGRWALLYRALWRLTHGEPHLLEQPVDPDVVQLERLARQVDNDAHRMQAFVRFRKTLLEGQSWWVAWYEPDHDTLELSQEFFINRFASHCWSILTPRRCMHWDGRSIRFSPGAHRAAAPSTDDLEPLWLAYYSHIFNPARVNSRALQAHLPRRYWKNLPETGVIQPLLREAPRRTERMIERSRYLVPSASDYTPAQPPDSLDLKELSLSAAACRACPLWRTATCTVFGEGPADASVVLVGEQPGDQEDRAGKPFVGPAGQLLDRALSMANLHLERLYVTNAVKHFKSEPRGKRRIHAKPVEREIASCRPWLTAELRILQPVLTVALGSTAAQSLLGQRVRVSEERGHVLDGPFGKTLVTVHPSSLLRASLNPSALSTELERFASDLRVIGELRN